MFGVCPMSLQKETNPCETQSLTIHLSFQGFLWTISQGWKESIVVRAYFEFDDVKRALKLQLYDQQIFSFFSNKNLNGIKQKYIDSGKEWIYW